MGVMQSVAIVTSSKSWKVQGLTYSSNPHHPLSFVKFWSLTQYVEVLNLCRNSWVMTFPWVSSLPPQIHQVFIHDIDP